MTRRLFFALEFPAEIRLRLAQHGRELSALAESGRWTRQENLHLTLQFLGDCPDEWMPELTRVIRALAADWPPFNLEFAGAGTFGCPGNILWLGIRPQPLLSGLAARLRSLLDQQGLPCDARPFSPHITIGRQVRIDTRRLSEWSMAPLSCRIDSISLMESAKMEERLVYRPIMRETLMGN